MSYQPPYYYPSVLPTTQTTTTHATATTSSLPSLSTPKSHLESLMSSQPIDRPKQDVQTSSTHSDTTNKSSGEHKTNNQASGANTPQSSHNESPVKLQTKKESTPATTTSASTPVTAGSGKLPSPRTSVSAGPPGGSSFTFQYPPQPYPLSVQAQRPSSLHNILDERKSLQGPPGSTQGSPYQEDSKKQQRRNSQQYHHVPGGNTTKLDDRYNRPSLPPASLPNPHGGAPGQQQQQQQQQQHHHHQPLPPPPPPQGTGIQSNGQLENIYWDKDDVDTLRELLEIGERAKWKYISAELTKERNKRITAVACQKKFKDMFGVAEASSVLGSSLCYVVSQNGWSSLDNIKTSASFSPTALSGSGSIYHQPPPQAPQAPQALPPQTLNHHHNQQGGPPPPPSLSLAPPQHLPPHSHPQHHHHPGAPPPPPPPGHPHHHHPPPPQQQQPQPPHHSHQGGPPPQNLQPGPLHIGSINPGEHLSGGVHLSP